MITRSRLILPFLFFGTAANAQQSDSFSVFFHMDQATLTADSKAQIDSLFYADWLHTSSKVSIIGYADYVGGKGAYNDALSKSRAEQVADYLIKSRIPQANITLIQGRGALERPGSTGAQGVPGDRRVTIVRNSNQAPALPRDTIRKAAPPIKDLSELKKGEALRLDNIYFYPGRHVVRPESYPAMEQLLQALKAHPTVRIGIEGHICCIANGWDGLDIDTGEPVLSQNRARFILEWLVQNGIDRSRLEWKGFGRTRPLIPVERSEEDANKNRRVEIRILSK